MSIKQFNEELKRFHAQTFARIGEDNPIFKGALVFSKKSLNLPDNEKVILLFDNELKAMKEQPCAYFEFMDKVNDHTLTPNAHFAPKEATRDLYKWIHNGFPDETCIRDTDTGKENRYYLPVSNLEKIMTYPTNEKIEFQAPVSTVKPVSQIQGSLTSAFDKADNNLPLDTPLSKVTLGQFLEALKSIK